MKKLKTEVRKLRRAGFSRNCLVCDFEHFNFLHLEILRTREKRLPVQSGVVGVTAAKIARATVSACIAVIVNTNVIKACAPAGTTTDCQVLLFGLQRKPPRREVARILQPEKETLQTRIGLPSGSLLPLHRSEALEVAPVCVQNPVRVFAWPSQRRWKSPAPKPSRPPGHSGENRFPRNSSKISGKSATISEPSAGAGGAAAGAVVSAG
jgi:hypothetical protein